MTPSDRKFFKPVVGGLVTLMAAVTGYVQYLQYRGNADLATEVRILKEYRIEDVKRSDQFGADIDNFKVMLSDIRSDVSFIKGKLERR